MDAALRTDILTRLKADYAFKQAGSFLREGKCPACGKKTLWVGTETPWTVRCDRQDKCGHEFTVKDAFPDLFDNWSARHIQTQQAPHAAADAYLRDGRGLNTARLSGAYTQELYRDRATGETSATVRFPVPAYGDSKPGWWERIIDRPWRFGKKKANFPYGWQYGGLAWHHPDLSLNEIAAAREVWLAEGVFDACALNEAFARTGRNAIAVASLSTSNFAGGFLEALAEAVGTKASRPTLVFAYDTGPAGTAALRKHTGLARDAGWRALAAQPTPDGEGSKQDWNDLWQARSLGSEDIETALGNGAITIAPSAKEKAFLLWKRHKRSGFPLTFNGRTFWASVPTGRLNQKMEETSPEATHESREDRAERMEQAVQEVLEVQEIANCTFRALYFERDLDLDESSYFLQVDFPGRQDRVKANFAGAALAGGGDFKKRLISVAPGAIYTGDTNHLDAIMRTQLTAIRTVEALHFTGYSIEHGAWVLGDIAVQNGRVLERNAEDYFELGKLGIKLRGTSRLLTINWEREINLDTEWWGDFYTAFGPRGLVTLAYWFATLFAEQIRAWQKSFHFLELSGEAGTGKSTLLMFLWKLLGRGDDYEGFDPAKATSAAIARNLARVANLPVVMTEGDRTQDQPHSKRFDWEELKSLYNGQSSRARGKANGGLETFEPKFRGSLVIGQNRPVEASPPVLERILGLHFDKSGFSTTTKIAAERIERMALEDVSGWIIEMTRREAQIMETYRAAFAHHEARLLEHPEVRNYRLAKVHAQTAGMLDALAEAMPCITPGQVEAAHHLITRACVDRHAIIDADHPVVRAFWELFDHVHEADLAKGDRGLNHSRRADTIAISLAEVEQAIARAQLRLPAPMLELQKLLTSSKSRKFLRKGTVNSRFEKSIHCWQFADGPTQSTTERKDA